MKINVNSEDQLFQLIEKFPLLCNLLSVLLIFSAHVQSDWTSYFALCRKVLHCPMKASKWQLCRAKEPFLQNKVGALHGETKALKMNIVTWRYVACSKNNVFYLLQRIYKKAQYLLQQIYKNLLEQIYKKHNNTIW